MLEWRVGIWGDGLELRSVEADSSRLLSEGLQKAVVSHRTQIYGPVHGATTHENSATMSLYGYGLAYYVVETSLGMLNMVRIERGSWDLTSS
jgi:hypothetical protein